MPDFTRIFDNSTARFQSGLYAAVASMSVWREIFKDMRRGLEQSHATAEEIQRFQAAIRGGIDAAGGWELTSIEKSALRDVLASAFDDFARAVPAHLAPKAQFLRNVKVPN